MSYNHTLIALSVSFVFLASCFNAFGATATKITSAANRSVIEQSRVIVVWSFFLSYQGVGHEEFQPTKVIGFLFIVLGVLFFNNIIALDGCNIKFLPKEI